MNNNNNNNNNNNDDDDADADAEDDILSQLTWGMDAARQLDICKWGKSGDHPMVAMRRLSVLLHTEQDDT
eukprot:6484030-Amphidinium_carterae.1